MVIRRGKGRGTARATEKRKHENRKIMICTEEKNRRQEEGKKKGKRTQIMKETYFLKIIMSYECDTN